MQRPFAPVLAFLLGLVLLCDAAVLVVHWLDDNTSIISARTRPRTRESTEVVVVPAPGQAFLTGSIDTLTAEKAQVQPLPMPVTLNAVERGVGRLSIDRALMGGRRVTITWDGGTPLPISGGGSLEIGTTNVSATADGLSYLLDGASRRLTAGTYTLGTTVAVSSGAGLGTPREGVQFTADKDTVLNSRGNVVVRMPIQKVDLLGPGTISAKGRLKVQFPDRTVNGGSVRFGEGPYRVSLVGGDNGTTVDAILQGDVQVG